MNERRKLVFVQEKRKRKRKRVSSFRPTLIYRLYLRVLSTLVVDAVSHTVFIHLFIAGLCPEFVPGDGSSIGSSTNDLIIVDPELRGEDCVNECVKRRVEDKAINGVTVRQDGKPGCICKKNMESLSKSSEYKTCLIEPSKNLFLFLLLYIFNSTIRKPMK